MPPRRRHAPRSRAALSTLLRLFAPFLPFVTEEVWSWWQPGSVHRAAWPTVSGVTGDPRALDAVSEVLGQVRRAKTEAKVSQRAAVAVAAGHGAPGSTRPARVGENDLIDAGSIISLTLQASDSPGIDIAIELAPAGTEFERDRRS